MPGAPAHLPSPGLCEAFSMSDAILYPRFLAQGPAVRIRRTSEAGATPVTAVLEVDRRGDNPRANAVGPPPPLMHCEAATEGEIVEILEPHARDDRMIARMMREKGLR